MTTQKFDNISFIQGARGGKFPFCNTLFIDDQLKIIIDPGAGLEQLLPIQKEYRVDLVFNSHYHFDHIAYNYLFPEAKVYLHEKEAACFQDRREILRRTGFTELYPDEWVEEWISRTNNPDAIQSPYSPQNRYEWSLSATRVDGVYRWDEVFDFGSTQMKVIGIPGHTSGLSCFYFPEQKVVYACDIDLTKFGPWYGGPDSDIELFIESARKIGEYNANYFLTSHEMGIVDAETFNSELEKYLDIINRREERILEALARPVSLQELADLGLMYGAKFHIDEWVRAWEVLMLKKHLLRLLNKGLVMCEDGKYRKL